MSYLQEIFNNREIAIGLWGMVVVIIFLFTKPVKKFIKTVSPILFGKKFLVFYIVFFAFLGLVLYMLHWAEMWDYEMLKDTIFWVMFVELPLFIKTIEEAEGGHFFSKLIRENISIAVALEFFLGFWTFSLLIELILVPAMVSISCVYVFAKRERKFCSIRHFFEKVFQVWKIIILANAILGLAHDPNQFFNVDTLKSFLLPLVLLVLNLPVVYGLALYNGYEQIFNRIKESATEQRKMKIQVIRFAGINLEKVFAIRTNLQNVISDCQTAIDLKKSLNNLTMRLELRIGDNYMKRSHDYILAGVVGFLISLIGLICSNSGVSLKEIIAMNFVFDVPRIKEILTYIFSTMIAMSVILLIFTTGFNKKQKEDISQIKKYALYELLQSVKRQKTQLMEYPPIEEPVNLFVSYVLNVYEIRIACGKVLAGYENLLTTWERDTIGKLRDLSIILSCDFGITEDESEPPRVDHFVKYYNEQVRSAPQNETTNTFICNVRTNVNGYAEQVNQFCEDFKYYYK